MGDKRRRTRKHLGRRKLLASVQQKDPKFQTRWRMRGHNGNVDCRRWLICLGGNTAKRHTPDRQSHTPHNITIFRQPHIRRITPAVSTCGVYVCRFAGHTLDIAWQWILFVQTRKRQRSKVLRSGKRTQRCQSL